MNHLSPFENDTESENIGGLSFENGFDRVTISGDLEIAKDQVGLKRSKNLLALLEKIVVALEAEADLPSAVTDSVESPQIVDNPFTSNDAH